MRKGFFAFVLVSLVSYGYTQSVYTYDVKKDIVIGTLSLGMFVTPFFVDNKPDKFPGSFNKNDINGFDRSVMFSYNKTLDNISEYGVYGMLVLPIISTFGNMRDMNTWLTYGIMYSEAFFLTYGSETLLKNSIIRYRPYMYEGELPAGKGTDYYRSFPSGSTSLAFLSATFLSTTFSQEYPESKWKLPVIIGSYALAAGVVSMRITSGSHFMTDVIAGAAIGSFYGWVIPFLHKKHNNENNLAVNFTGNGLLVSLKF